MANRVTVVINCVTLPTCHIAKWIAYFMYYTDDNIIIDIKGKAHAKSLTLWKKHYLFIYWFSFRMIYL